MCVFLGVLVCTCVAGFPVEVSGVACACGYSRACCKQVGAVRRREGACLGSARGCYFSDETDALRSPTFNCFYPAGGCGRRDVPARRLSPSAPRHGLRPCRKRWAVPPQPLCPGGFKFSTSSSSCCVAGPRAKPSMVPPCSRPSPMHGPAANQPHRVAGASQGAAAGPAGPRALVLLPCLALSGLPSPITEAARVSGQHRGSEPTPSGQGGAL